MENDNINNEESKSFKLVSKLNEVDELHLNYEFIMIDKSVKTGINSSSSGSTVKVQLANMVDSVIDSLTTSTSPEEFEGAKGEKGEKGDKGNIGIQGVTGPNGIQGDTGQSGEKGEKGMSGDLGYVGDVGEQGDVGLKGDKGELGESGLKGSKGDAGKNGMKGEIGDTGQKGFKGSRGLDSPIAKGYKGYTGPYGIANKGIKGEKGDLGISGQKGEKGTKGTTGVDESVILYATDISGSDFIVEDKLLSFLDLQTEGLGTYSRYVIELAPGYYYTKDTGGYRFYLSEHSYCEIGFQLKDPVKWSPTPFSSQIFDKVENKYIPIFAQIVNEELSSGVFVRRMRILLHPTDSDTQNPIKFYLPFKVLKTDTY